MTKIKGEVGRREMLIKEGTVCQSRRQEMGGLGWWEGGGVKGVNETVKKGTPV